MFPPRMHGARCTVHGRQGSPHWGPAAPSVFSHVLPRYPGARAPDELEQPRPKGSPPASQPALVYALPTLRLSFVVPWGDSWTTIHGISRSATEGALLVTPRRMGGHVRGLTPTEDDEMGAASW